MNGVLSKPDADYGGMGGFLALLRLRAYGAGLDLLGRFVRWSVPPARRRFLAVRHTVAGRLEAPLCLPIGLGAGIIDFVGDLRLVQESGDRSRLFCGITRCGKILAKMGARFHAMRPRQARL